jgi:hypothetical protein
MSIFLRQIRAWFAAEWLRQATSPSAAALLVVWNLVCGLFVQVVVAYLARNELPAGESAMSFFFRGTPWLLPLLLVVFIPHLTAEAIAGRRANGRLEQLRIAGLKAGSLVTAAWLATMTLCALLAAVPLLIHAVFALQGGTDLGQTLMALLSLGAIAMSLSAIAMAVSCWSSNRLWAGLLSLAMGLAWWIADLFGHAFDAASWWNHWRAAVPMASFVYDAGVGLLAPAALYSHLLLTVTALYIARCGLRAQAGQRLASLDAGLAAICLVLLLGLGPNLDRRWDGTMAGSHAVAEQTRLSVREAAQKGGVQAILVATPQMRSDPVHGVIVAGCERLLQTLSADGLRWHQLDPGLDPAGAAQLARQQQLDHDDLTQPHLLLRHLARTEVLTPTDLAQIETEADGRQRVAALQAEGALLAALQAMRQQSDRAIAWASPPLSSCGEHADPTGRSLAWQQQIQHAGHRLDPINSWPELDLERHRGLVIPGLIRDLTPKQNRLLADFLHSGGVLILALDGRDPRPLPQWQALLADYGLHWDEALLLGPPEADQTRLPAITLTPTNSDAGPVSLAARQQRPLLLPYARACFPGRHDQLASWLPIPNDAARQLPDGSREALAWPHRGLLTCAKPRIALLASVSALSDAYLGTAGNELLAHGLSSWVLAGHADTALPPRAVISTRYQLSDTQASLLRWGLGFGLPAATLLLAALIRWRRRQVPAISNPGMEA